MSIFPLEYLHHIMDEIEYLIDRSANLSKEDFLDDETLKRAFVRSKELRGFLKGMNTEFKREEDRL
ncbi:MAG: hypothetical protein JRJ29_12765 [Deltaproteobacteria bacterium]|nr:hypothetical protein [Deltaproteobacteria bacterium]